jgi:hypothetical protein
MAASAYVGFDGGDLEGLGEYGAGEEDKDDWSLQESHLTLLVLLGSRSVVSSGGEFFHEFDVAFQKIVGREVLAILPDDLLELQIYGLAREFSHLVKLEADRWAVRIADGFGVDLGANGRFNLQFFVEFASQSGEGILARLDFAAGELPFEGMSCATLALTDQDPAIPFDHRGDDVHLAIIEARNG